MRRIPTLFAALVVSLVGLSGVTPGSADPRHQKGPARLYVVLYADDASLTSARAAVRAAGGVVLQENLAVGVAKVRSTNPNFMSAVAGQRALDGAARNRPDRPGAARSCRRTPTVEQDQTLGPGAIDGSARAAGRARVGDPFSGPAVGHEDDPRDREGLVQAPAG